MSCLFHVSPLASPSPQHPSRLWEPGPSLCFESTEAPAASSAWTTSRRPFAAAVASGPWPWSGDLGCRWRRDVPRHMSCFEGFRRIANLENWEFGPPFLIETCSICITTNTNQYHVSSGLGSRTSAMAYIQINSQVQ